MLLCLWIDASVAVHKQGLKVSYAHNFTSCPLGNMYLRDDTRALTVADLFRLARRMVVRKNRIFF